MIRLKSREKFARTANGTVVVLPESFLEEIEGENRFLVGLVMGNNHGNQTYSIAGKTLEISRDRVYDSDRMEAIRRVAERKNIFWSYAHDPFDIKQIVRDFRIYRGRDSEREKALVSVEIPAPRDVQLATLYASYMERELAGIAKAITPKQ